MWMFALALPATAGAIGCGGGSPPPAQTATAASDSAAAAPAPAPAPTSDIAAAGPTPAEGDEDESMADVKAHHRHHHHGGFAMFIAMSLDSLGTTPEQDAQIVKIRDDIHAKLMPAHDAEKNVLSVLADGIAAGRIDKAKVDAAIEKLSTASAGVHDAVADSLNQLHAVLTPEQRLALIDKVEAHFKVWHHATRATSPSWRRRSGSRRTRRRRSARASRRRWATRMRSTTTRPRPRRTSRRSPRRSRPTRSTPRR
jgi:Spy/CpxP family protein refolding chaperone